MKLILLCISIAFLMSAKGCGYDPVGLEPKLVNLAAGKVYKYTIIKSNPKVEVSEPVEMPLESINGHFCLTADESAEIRREWEKFKK